MGLKREEDLGDKKTRGRGERGEGRGRRGEK